MSRSHTDCTLRDLVIGRGWSSRIAARNTGECEVRGDDIGGIAVHIGARVSALAGPNEVLVSTSRCHHLMKTFCTGIGGWADQQYPHGTSV